MCGIGGIYWKRDENIKIKESWIKFLTINLTKRGDKAWGIFDGNKIYKTPGDFKIHIIKVPELLRYVTDLNSNLFLIHTRQPTRGSPEKNENNHPFVLNGLVFAHNGTVERVKKWQDDEIETDSYQILKFIDKKWNRKPNTLKKIIEKNFETFGTSQACWLYDNKNSMLYLWCAKLSSLYYYDCDLFFIFASTKEILKDSLIFYEFDRNSGTIIQRKMVIEDDKINDLSGHLLMVNLKNFNMQKVEIKEPKREYVSYTYWNDYGFWGYRQRFHRSATFSFGDLSVYELSGQRVQIETKRFIEYLCSSDIEKIATLLNKTQIFDIRKVSLSNKYNIIIHKNKVPEALEKRMTKIETLLRQRGFCTEITNKYTKYQYVDYWCIPLISIIFFGENNYFKIVTPMINDEKSKKENKLIKFLKEIKNSKKRKKISINELVEKFFYQLNPLIAAAYGFEIHPAEKNRIRIVLADIADAYAYEDGAELLKSFGITISNKTGFAEMRKTNPTLKRLLAMIFEDIENNVFPVDINCDELETVKKYLLGGGLK